MFHFFFKKEIPLGQYRQGGRKDRVLRFFEARKGQKVPLPEILKAFRDICEPCRVIRYLRADGHMIFNEEKRGKGNIVHSFYTYEGYDPTHYQKIDKKFTK